MGTPSSPAPPSGAPPRAGVVGPNGQLVLWRDGQPVVHASWPDAHLHGALQSRYGTVLLASDQAALVDHDGGLHLLGTDMGWRAAIDPAGERLALVETRTGRRPRSRLHLFRLRDRNRQTMPWPEEGVHFSVVAVRDDAVYFRPGSADVTWRWQPGSEPRPLPYQVHAVDPYTGRALGGDQEPGRLLIEPDGTVRRLGVGPTTALAPGGRHLYAWRYQPPALTLADVAAPDQLRIVELPDGSSTGSTAPGGPVWEDPEHVLVPARHHRNALGAPLVRLDVRTGAVETVALPEHLAHRPLLVVPLPVPTH